MFIFCLYFKMFPEEEAKKRSFGDHDGFGRGLDSVGGPDSLRGIWPLWSAVVSPWSPADVQPRIIFLTLVTAAAKL